jgi:hypothetical protein
MNNILIPVKWCLQKLLALAHRNYSFAKSYYMFRHRAQLKRYSRSPVIILQMGKVGSKSVRRSLEALNLDMAIYHSHLLTKERIDETEKKRKKFFRTERESYLKRPWLNQFLRKEICRKNDGKKWKIITLTRDPVARNLSTFFENLEVLAVNNNESFEIQSDYYDILPFTLSLDEVGVLFNLFFDKLRHDTPLVFFDRELKGVFGIDVYAEKFPKSIGYKIYQNKLADVLLIRLENLNSSAPQAFKKFLDIQDFTLKEENIGANKNYAELYKKFTETINLPANYLDKFYQSKFMKHFYTEQEINSFREHWIRR